LNKDDSTLQVNFGSLLVEFLIMYQLLDKVSVKSVNKTTITKLIVPKELRCNENNRYYIPFNVPMIIQPKPYSMIKLSTGKTYTLLPLD